MYMYMYIYIYVYIYVYIYNSAEFKQNLNKRYIGLGKAIGHSFETMNGTSCVFCCGYCPYQQALFHVSRTYSKDHVNARLDGEEDKSLREYLHKCYFYLLFRLVQVVSETFDDVF